MALWAKCDLEMALADSEPGCLRDLPSVTTVDPLARTPRWFGSHSCYSSDSWLSNPDRFNRPDRNEPYTWHIGREAMPAPSLAAKTQTPKQERPRVMKSRPDCDGAFRLDSFLRGGRPPHP